MTTDVLERAAGLLAAARRVVALTGAGMSQESGLRTFRDHLTGFWSRYDPTELATEAAFRRHPARVFGWYLGRWRKACEVTPHRGHRALVALERVFEEFVVVTQNVDRLHQRAGSRNVVELHGSLEAFRCLDGGHPYPVELIEGLGETEGEVEPPLCPSCGSLVRPGVVWFGESLPEGALEQAASAVGRCDALLVVGTSSVVYPAASLADVALARGVPVLEVNPRPTPLTPRAAVRVPAAAGEALAVLASRLAPAVGV
ncbi:MAG: NAD-dependent deacetylase [Gemmatimonadales bacterium]